jgi:pyruvate formate lyase activating enzyme
MFKGAVWGSTLDYPGHISDVLFVGKCNLQCEYCHNKNIDFREDLDTKEVLNKLISRREYVDHIIISGGEPTMYGKELLVFIKRLHSLGFHVGMHTNGTNPRVLKSYLPFLEFVGMDIKTSLGNYSRVGLYKSSFGFNRVGKIKKSISLILKSEVKYEFRTTMHRQYVSWIGILRILRTLSSFGVSEYVLQTCRNSAGGDLNTRDISTRAEFISSTMYPDIKITVR